MSAVPTLFKDLLYGGRNEYLDIIRTLGLLGGLIFLILAILEFAGLGSFDEVTFAGSWATLIGATTGAIYARNRSDRQKGEDA